MKQLLVMIILGYSINTFSADYTLECSNSDLGFFVATFMDEDYELKFNEFSFEGTSVDKHIFDAQFTEDEKVIKARPSFYDYFIGYIQLDFDVRMQDRRVGEKFQIKLTLNDGDGFGFDEKPFRCFLSQITL